MPLSCPAYYINDVLVSGTQFGGYAEHRLNHTCHRTDMVRREILCDPCQWHTWDEDGYPCNILMVLFDSCPISLLASVRYKIITTTATCYFE